MTDTKQPPQEEKPQIEIPVDVILDLDDTMKLAMCVTSSKEN